MCGGAGLLFYEASRWWFSMNLPFMPFDVQRREIIEGLMSLSFDE
ncbi:hypothetical protein [Bartonella elizabethae]|nr:hypothetical protein [Bartonella elizabethae]